MLKKIKYFLLYKIRETILILTFVSIINYDKVFNGFSISVSKSYLNLINLMVEEDNKLFFVGYGKEDYKNHKYLKGAFALIE